ncbi:glycosyltransferase family 2 protein [Shinella kummerowiae]|uniref:glycosyltransferase family 2 protein n=1 Tax=Shinella kummerowiae TaxID=417745 RepID=UPI0021B66AE0|nr:glycosyltransferase family 2 protein [Shinella kummerowiae]MCT7667995.1 glycosyltransferase [Shinella kummerowiae]
MNPDISVILPTYNRTKPLVAAMESVLAQSYGDLELIVVDDASSDDVESVVKGFADARVRYIRRDRNGGAGAARNTGLAAARGRLIAFQDSDDLWLPGKLERQVAFFDALSDDVRVVIGGKIVYGRDPQFRYGAGKVAHAPPPNSRLRLDEDQLGHLLAENRISVQNALFRRDCMPDLGWFDECLRANEDWEFAVRLVQQTRVFEDIEPVVLGFISADSISTNRRRQLMGEFRILRKNGRVLAARRLDRSRLRIGIAIGLYNSGKKRSAMRFLLAGLRDRPANVAAVVRSLARRLARVLVNATLAAPQPHSER